MYNFDYRVHFIVSHKSSDLSKYTNLIKGLPFEQITNGDDRYNKFGKKLNRKANLSYLKWRLHTEEEVSSEHQPLDKVIFSCINQISNQQALIDEIHSLDVEMAIEIAVRPHDSYSVITITPKLFESLSKNGIQIDMCFVVPPGRLY
jgi:hypothetical protein